MAGIKFRMNIFSFCLRVTVILFVLVLVQESIKHFPIPLAKIAYLPAGRQEVIADHAYGGSRQRREGDFLGVKESIKVTHCENRSKLSRSDFLAVTVFAQDSLSIDNPQDVESMQKRLEQALLKVDQENQNKQEALNAQLRQSLDSEIEKWISTEKKARELEVDKIVKGKWEKSTIIGDPLSYEYHFRSYDYVDKVIDIIKGPSLSSPYQGIVRITERLYLEMTHPPEVARRDKYFYVANRPVKLVFECPQDKFVLADVVYSKPSIVKGWPEDLIRKFYTEMKQRGIR